MRFTDLRMLQPQVCRRLHDSLSLDGQVAVVDPHVELVFGDSRQVGPQRNALAVLIDIDGRRDRHPTHGLFALGARYGRRVAFGDFGGVVHDSLPNYWMVTARGFEDSRLPTVIDRQ